jgi:hypothetical protein
MSHRMNSTANTANPFKRVPSNAFERVSGGRPRIHSGLLLADAVRGRRRRSHRMNSTAGTANPFKRVPSNAFERVSGGRPRIHSGLPLAVAAVENPSNDEH